MEHETEGRELQSFEGANLRLCPWERRFWTDDELKELIGQSSMTPINTLRSQGLLFPARYRNEHDRWARAWLYDDVCLVYLANSLRELTGFNQTVISLILGRIGRKRIIEAVSPEPEYTSPGGRIDLATSKPLLDLTHSYLGDILQNQKGWMGRPLYDREFALFTINRQYVVMADPISHQGQFLGVGQLSYTKSKYPKCQDVNIEMYHWAAEDVRCLMANIISPKDVNKAYLYLKQELNDQHL